MENQERSVSQQGEPGRNSEPNMRSKKKRFEDRERNYKCSCGLSYLSYPALYTHVKLKHSGKAPGIIQMPKTQKGTRLKKYKFDQQHQDIFNESKYLKTLLSYLHSLSPTPPNLTYKISQLFCNIKPQDGAPLVDSISECQQHPPNYTVIDHGIYNISIDHAFSRFLLKLTNKVDYQILQQITVLLLIWRRTINNSYGKFQKEKFNCYSRDANCGNVLQVVNELVMVEFVDQGYRFKRVMEQGCLLFREEKRMFHLIKFVFLMARWMMAVRYTGKRLQLNRLQVVGEGQ